MLRIVEAIIGLELREQSGAERAALCQGKIHASEAVRSAAERARYQGNNYTPPPMICPHPPSKIMKIRPCPMPTVASAHGPVCPQSPMTTPKLVVNGDNGHTGWMRAYCPQSWLTTILTVMINY